MADRKSLLLSATMPTNELIKNIIIKYEYLEIEEEQKEKKVVLLLKDII